MSSGTHVHKTILHSVGVLAGIAVSGCLLIWIYRTALYEDLERSRHEFECLTPLADELRRVQSVTASNQGMLSEYSRWSGERGLPMCNVLRSVQENIPSEMVLYHFSAGVEPAGEKEAPACTLYFSGTAQGRQTVVEAKRQLNSDLRLRRFCSEIKLVSSQRDFGDDWAFAFEGSRMSGGTGE